jgi:aldose sugar dehydrogenase
MNIKIILSVLFFCGFNSIFGQLVDPIPNDDWAISQVGPNNLLTNPYDIELAPDGYLWITERTLGDISRFDPITGAKDLLIHLNSFGSGPQDGLMGLVLHPEFGKGTGQDYVYVAYTYDNVVRKLRLSRFSYTKTANDGLLSNELMLLEGLPGSTDHNSGRFVIGPDLKLYYTLGDQGANQYANKCNAIRAQILPASPTDYINYMGKILRINLDGSIPLDNPILGGIRSHVYSYGHRNVQGIVFGNNGKLYASEHGPKSDDELNSIESGKNYGWPYIAGYNDDQAYKYCNWSLSSTCATSTYSEYSCPSDVTPVLESSWSVPVNYKNPMITWGTVDNSYDFQGTCGLVCWPTIAPCGMAIYKGNAIPNWGTSLLSTSLKRGRIYRGKVTTDGNGIEAIPNPEPDSTNDDFEELWYTPNRYRDIVVAPDGVTFYIITDSSGSTSGPSNNSSIVIKNPGIIIKVKYIGTTLNVSNYLDKTGISILPNPAQNEFSIQYPNDQIVLDKIQIIDLKGRLIKEVKSPRPEESIVTSQLENGLYIVLVYDSLGKSELKKLIINR